MEQETHPNSEYKRVVGLAVDESPHSVVALDCKYFSYLYICLSLWLCSILHMWLGKSMLNDMYQFSVPVVHVSEFVFNTRTKPRTF